MDDNDPLVGIREEETSVFISIFRSAIENHDTSEESEVKVFVVAMHSKQRFNLNCCGSVVSVTRQVQSTIRPDGSMAAASYVRPVPAAICQIREGTVSDIYLAKERTSPHGRRCIQNMASPTTHKLHARTVPRAC